MELIMETEDKKIFVEGNTTYTMIDMGNYIGYKDRPWYTAHPEIWVLMELDEKNNESLTHVEALVNDKGDFIRFIIDSNGIRRALQLDNGLVYNDSIVVLSNNPLDFQNSYNALDGDIYSKEKYPIVDYIKKNPSFEMHGDTLEGEIPSIEYITKFLIANEQLKNQINETQKTM